MAKYTALNDALYDYLWRSMDREPPVLRRLREETAALPMAVMQIAPDQGQLMAMLARLVGARRTLEVGTFTGYSALVVALALPDDGYTLCCDVSEEWTEIARRYWDEAGVGHRIELALGPALDTLDRCLDDGGRGSFDLAFIDADKANYRAYFQRCLDLVRPGGLVLIDNVLWGGAVVDPARGDPDTRAIRALNEALRGDQRCDLVVLPVGDGLTVARRR